MTAKEHKAAYRAAVQERIEGLKIRKERAFEVLRATELEREFIARSWKVDILWEIVDQLVDDIYGLHGAQQQEKEKEEDTHAGAF